MTMQFRSMIRMALACAVLLGWGMPTGFAEDAPAETPASAEHAAPDTTEGAKADGHDGHDAKEGDEAHPKKKAMNLQKDLALWSLVTFFVFVLVLKTFAWKPLIAGLDQREANFRNQLAQAEAARVQAEMMLREHARKLESVQDEVKAIIEEARRDAERTKHDIIETAQKEATTTQNRAIHEIERARDQALKELFDVMAGQVANATEHVIGRSLTGDDQNRLIQEALSQFSA